MSTIIMKIFADRLKELRTCAELTQKEIAERLNVKQQSYNRYELNTGEPSFETLVKIAKLFQVSTDYLLGIADY